MGYFLRLLLIAVVVWLAVQFLRRLLNPGPRQTRRADANLPPRMLPCAYCGVHVPENEAVIRGGRAFCSSEHLALEERGS